MNDNFSWKTSNQTLPLRSNEVHIWSADLSSDSSQIEHYWQLLSLDEKDRANRFKLKKLRTYYITTRGILRKLIASYLGITPESFEFQYNDYGKPSLKMDTPLQFNLSHSAGIGVFAFTLDAVIGVDVELVKTDFEIKKLTTRFFSKNESQIILSLPEALQYKVFFNCWTRKESFIKGHGEGLSLPLDQFEVSVLDEIPVELRAIYWNMEEVKEWFLASFEIKKNVIGAYAVKSANKNQAKHFCYDKSI